MANHPSRAWRSRAHHALTSWLLRTVPPDTVHRTLDPEALDRLLASAYLAGYEAGRKDHLPRPAAPTTP